MGCDESKEENLSREKQNGKQTCEESQLRVTSNLPAGETSQCPETTLTHGSARRGVEREKLGVEIMA